MNSKVRSSVEVCHEVRQILQATPEAVDVTYGHLQPNRLAHVDAPIAAKGAPRTVGPGGAVQDIRPAASDAAVQQWYR
jgi:hypothetical protein